MNDLQEPVKPGWVEILKNFMFVPYLLVCLYVLPRLPVVTTLDRLVAVVMWSGVYFLFYIYISYQLDCWSLKPDERPGLFRYSAEGSRNVLPVFCFLILSSAFIGFVSVHAYPADDKSNLALTNGDFIFFAPASYIVTPPGRGDIVQYDTAGTGFIRRIIGLPGETIEIQDGVVTINGRLLDEPNRRKSSIGSKLNVRKVLASDEYLILGDDRSALVEQEMFARRKNILGKAFFRYLPISRIGLLPDVRYSF